ncbi:YdbH domain-containing protein [Novosphingobium mangrovi (ex Huang et al. 2023)]|uniref:YdbH domain-containing protein n=1 Tax=Novosphingobium mangrovi (ex Huang et al. 2023) TaxID=2976432 RepID=A0ABT2I743_9SPHN|nr:YdbH domain-containing protein [Novosphingobium mangrovi (ex Huang et al. 2023)]MCT2400629.1 YdbH domain-containing protein [Novosphingobium mangrovi (ex Huang et al. 2023)]
MAQEQDQPPEPDFAASETSVTPARCVRWRRVMLALAALLVVVLGSVWVMRKDIADDVISGELESMGLPAHYEVVSIGPSEQVVRNLVIGDPKKPDFSAAELRVATRLYWGLPGIGRITVVRPRLYGAYHDGKMSFGSLDKVLFTGKAGPFEMPDLDVAVVDGRALIESDNGRIGAKLTGEGPLRGGFSGELAAVAPELSFDGCKAGRTSIYGKVTTASEKPRFEGPVRMAGLGCPDREVAVAQAGLTLDVTLDKALDGGEGKLGFKAGAGRYGDNRLDGASGTANFTYRGRSLNARYDLEARGVRTPQARLARLSFDGRARSAEGLARFDVDSDIGGKGIALGTALDQTLRDAQRTGEGTLVAPLAAQMRSALALETRASTLVANVLLRRTDEGFSLVVPQGSLKGGSGSSLLTLSRVQAMFGTGGLPRVTGNFATGGRGLPQVSGRMESGNDGRLAMHVTMPGYRAGDTRVALPQLALVQGADGALTFTGKASLTGDLPGGRAENLILPIAGSWGANGDLAVWPRCAQVAFDRLQFASLTLDRRSLSVCPVEGRAVVQGRGGNLRVAAGVSGLDLFGHLGETPIRIVSGPLGFVQDGTGPGVLKATALAVDLGPEDGVSQFRIADLDARVGAETAGTFGGADLGLYAVPLDLRRTAGNWRYADGVLTIDGAIFTLVDREKVARFQPMVARDATLRLADNIITAQAVIREPESGREVVRADIVHDLGSATGHADLTADGIRFDDKLQADTLSALALGIVSSLEGTVRGTGRIDWNEKGVTSHGRLATDGVDFAAPFGPVKGLSGEVVFTDLLGLVTAPDQRLKLASINPGIEVTDGILSFEMKPDHYLQVNSAHWPFMGGTLALEPAHMKIGVAETRYYTLKVEGLDATTFVRHLEMDNLNASGVFDGRLPLVFDENGGRIEEGHLVSRPPGGNVAYVGELTYKDLSAMGNFAFDTLKSVNFQSMEISLGGDLAGEIITRVSFTGLSQGLGAKQNFLTKQVAKLPIRFVLNIKAPFFSLFAPLRSLYDPSYVTDPRTLGLIGIDGVPKARGRQAPAVSAIQPPVSENNP